MLAVSTRGHRAALSHGRQIEIAFAVRTGACRRDQRVGIDRRRPDRVRRAGIGFEDRAIAKPKSGGGRIGLTGGGLIVGPPPQPFPSEGMTARSEEHTSELPSLMRNSYAVFCLKKKKTHTQ